MSKHFVFDRKAARGTPSQWRSNNAETRFARTSWLGGEQNKSTSAHGPSASPAMDLSLLQFPIVALPIQALGDNASAEDSYEQEAHAVAKDLASNEHKVKRPIARMGGRRGGLQGVHPQLHAKINRARSGGAQLPAPLSKQMGSQLGADLHGVRVHDDSQADGLTRMLNAQAFTSGRDVFFRRGHYNPTTSVGRSVLTHELTHVVQQCGPSSQGGGDGSGAPVQRLIMQLGADKDDKGKEDQYLKLMRNRLSKIYKGERSIKGNAVWKEADKPYHPKIKKYKSIMQGYGSYEETDTQLSKLPDQEAVRIVAHGNSSGRVGGYSADQLVELLIRLGLPKSHTGGIDIHACLPAYDDGKQRQPTVVLLQDKLKQEGYQETVRGYQHCIVPEQDGDGIEVSNFAYRLWADVLKPLLDAAANYQPVSLKSDENGQKLDRVEIIKSFLGEARGRSLVNRYAPDGDHVEKDDVAYLAHDIKQWMQSKEHYQFAQLRRANSVRLQNLDLQGLNEEKKDP